MYKPRRASVGRAVGGARLILVNGPPASGKSTVARRYVDDHDRSALVEVATLQMALPNWENDEATRDIARDLAGAAITQHERESTEAEIHRRLRAALGETAITR